MTEKRLAEADKLYEAVAEKTMKNLSLACDYER
jgi:hypothetical protein